MRSLLVFALLAATLPGQTLLRDINTSPSSNSQTLFGSSVTLGNRVLFGADDLSRGAEPYVLDASGARLLQDIYPGVSGSHPSFLGTSGGVAVFLATDNQGAGIWISDGTPAGTSVIARFPAIEGGTLWNGAVWFWVYQGVPGTLQLWKATIATPSFTQVVASLPLNSRVGMQVYGLPNALVTLVGSTAIFSDGTAAGTAFGPRLWDYALGDRGAVLGNELLFPAGTSPNGIELWKTDGTLAGTVLVKDLIPGVDSSIPSALVPLAGKVAFRAYDGFSYRLWVSDGTALGTTILGAREVGSEVVSNGTAAYFSAFRGGSGFELWTSDGTPGGTREVANISPGGDSNPSRFVFAGSRVWFAADDGSHGREPWSSDGTAAGTVLAKDIRPGLASSMPNDTSGGGRPFAVGLGGVAYFGADDGIHGYEIWRAAPGTAPSLFADLNGRLTADARIQQVVVRDKEAFFIARDDLGLAIWRSDGTPAGTRVAIRNVPNPMLQIEGLQVFRGRLIFRATESAAGTPITLFASDGTEAGTVRLTPPFTFSPYEFSSVVLQDRLWFPWRDTAHGSELWSTDGTITGTGIALDVTPGPTDSNPRYLAGTGERIFFASASTPVDGKLWSSDGTSAGTVQLASGSAQFILSPVALGNVLLFDTIGTGFTRSDGTPAGTYMLDPGFQNGRVVFQGRVWFGKLANGAQAELWSTDATLAGTRREQAFPPAGNTTTGISSLAVAGDRLFFALLTTATGQELWSTDGSPNGAALVREIAPGATSGASGPFKGVATNTRALFPAFDPLLGTELFVSDGTSAGTKLVADMNPGPGYSSPGTFVRLDRQVLFVADDGVHGAELFAMDLASIGGALAEPFGASCGASPAKLGAAGAPTLGSLGFWTTLEGAPGSAPLAWVLGAMRQDVPLYGCTFHVGGPWLAVSGSTSPLGTAALPIPVPNDPRLLGGELYAQAVVADGGWFTISNALQMLVGRR